MRNPSARRLAFALLLFALIASFTLIPNPTRSLASSHREAPLIVADPLADNTDTYAFRSTEPGREGFVTLIANWIPFQEPSGGPHFYKFDDTVLYEIYIDNTGDGVEDVTYQFRFKTKFPMPTPFSAWPRQTRRSTAPAESNHSSPRSTTPTTTSRKPTA